MNYKNMFKTSCQLLETAIRNIWTEMSIGYIQDLYKSISKRLKQVIIKFIDCFQNVITCLSLIFVCLLQTWHYK